MDETSKTKAVWGNLERSILTGRGIDIGCGQDPVNPDVRRFDVQDGDANDILRNVTDRFDFVYSSHCLEHMRNADKALRDWWELVKPGGYLFFIVPDEDLYEQGVFPSRFNPDHKASFTISKAKSWSPVSINVLDLVSKLPDSHLVSLNLQDHGYDRNLNGKGNDRPTRMTRLIIKAYGILKRLTTVRLQSMEILEAHFSLTDQTLRPGVLAQIQCIVKKLA